MKDKLVSGRRCAGKCVWFHKGTDAMVIDMISGVMPTWILFCKMPHERRRLASIRHLWMPILLTQL